MTTISPGSTSRTNRAWIKSRAQVSLASTQAPSSWPRQRGRKPCGSRRPISSFSVMMTSEKAPSMRCRLWHEVVALAVQGGLGQQVQDDFAINGGLEDRAFGLQLVAEPGGVGEVAVVRDGNLAAGAIDGERLGVAQVRRAGGGIAGVADGDGADHVVQDVPMEDLRHQPHAFMGVELFAVGGDDAGAFLSAVLEGVEAVVGQFGGVGVAVNAEDAAVMFWVVIHQAGLLSVNAWLGRWSSTRGRAVRASRNSRSPRGS